LTYRARLDQRGAAQASSFGAAAAAYQRARPPYPTEAVDWLLPAGASRVLDLGAGTGKLTRQLCDRGLDVVAVEPSAGMREQLALSVPEARLLAGTAEQIPLDDGAVDAVLVAQAWHWIDPARAVPEVARVLAPGGRLGLVWNVRDESHDWVAELGRIMHRFGDDESDDPRPVVGPPFGPLERRAVAWRFRLARDAVLDLVASRSYVIVLPPDERDAVLAEVRHLLDTDPSLAGRNEVELPYVTQCFRAKLT
jgi:SAM-dependent methyltransferase